MPADKKTLKISLLVAVMVMFALLASACVSAPAPKIVPPQVTLPVRSNGTSDTVNASTVPPMSPPPIICHCPMEPAGTPLTVIPTANPDDGRCYCP